jgi:hypothetical protein
MRSLIGSYFVTGNNKSCSFSGEVYYGGELGGIKIYQTGKEIRLMREGRLVGDALVGLREAEKPGYALEFRGTIVSSVSEEGIDAQLVGGEQDEYFFNLKREQQDGRAPFFFAPHGMAYIGEWKVGRSGVEESALIAPFWSGFEGIIRPESVLSIHRGSRLLSQA